MARRNNSSMTALLVISGSLGVAALFVALRETKDPVVSVFALCGIAVWLGYVYVGFRFKTLITESPRQVFGVLGAGVAVLAVMLVGAAVRGVHQERPLVLGLAGLYVTAHLILNARRLAGEAREVSAGAPVAADVVELRTRRAAQR